MQLFDRFRRIGAAYQQAKRLRDIAAVLLKYGYDDLAQHLPLPRAARLPLRRVREQQAEMQQLSQPERLRRACEELGPTFVKLGQLAAARTRILPPEFTDELAKLQDQVAPLDFAAVRAVMEEELQRPFSEVFARVTEELVRRLDPKQDLIAQARPFMEQARLERLRPRRLVTGALEFAQEFAEAARELPLELRRIVSQLKTGRARLNFRHEGLEPASQALERSANRLSFALVVAALIIASSVVIHAMVPPLWGNVSLLGLIGYLLAGLMGFWLLIAILRHGKM